MTYQQAWDSIKYYHIVVAPRTILRRDHMFTPGGDLTLIFDRVLLLTIHSDNSITVNTDTPSRAIRSRLNLYLPIPVTLRGGRLRWPNEVPVSVGDQIVNGKLRARAKPKSKRVAKLECELRRVMRKLTTALGREHA
jgi:hypothetical protein